MPRDDTFLTADVAPFTSGLAPGLARHRHGAPARGLAALEGKNARTAWRLGWPGLMAVSLAACGGSDDDDDNGDGNGNGAADPSREFLLTEDIDAGAAFTGGSGADTFAASDATFTTGDALDGGEGTDIFNLSITAPTNALVDTVRIENFFVRTTADLSGPGDALDGSGWVGVEQLWNDRSTDNLFVEGLTVLPIIGVIRGSATRMSIDVDGAAVDLSGTADAVTIVTQDADLDWLAIGDNDAPGFGSVESVTIVNSGDSVIDEIVDAAIGGALIGMSALTVSGSGSLDLHDDGTTDTQYAALSSVASTGVALTLDIDNGGLDAGADTTLTSTGADDDITLTAADGTASDAAVTTVSLGAGENVLAFTDGAGLQTTSVTTEGDADAIAADLTNASLPGSAAAFSTGAGDDEVSIAANANVALTVDLGAGNDVLTIDTINAGDSLNGGAGAADALRALSANLAAIEADADQVATLSGFERVIVADALSDDINLTTWGADTIVLEDADTSAGTLTLSSGDTLVFAEAETLAGTVTTGAIVLDVEGASDAGSVADLVRIEARVDFDAAHDFTTAGNHIDVDFVERLAISVSDSDTETEGTGSAIFTFANAERVDTITVVAEQATVIDDDGTTDFTALDTFSAAGSSAGVTFDAGGATQGVTMTGGNGDDAFTGSDFADAINLGNGDNTYTASTGADTVVLGNGASTLDFSAANVSVEGAITTVSGFDAVQSAAAADTLNMAATVLATGVGIDVSGADAEATATDISASVTNGVITLGGADAGAIDTLAEWIDVAEEVLNADGDTAAEVAAFEFDGDTYVIESDATDTTVAIIRLAGVTGIEAVDTTAAAATVLIA